MAPTLTPEARALLDHLHRGGAYSFWWSTPTKRTEWFEVGQYRPLPNGRSNAYYGVHPVHSLPTHNSAGIEVGTVDPATGRPVSLAGVRSQTPLIAAINCLYAEFDVKQEAFGGDWAALDAHVADLLPPPSAIVESGGGLHVYWLLAAPYLLDTPERRERAREAQADWVARVGGDPGAKDLTRVLRVPGTLNHKYDPPRPVSFRHLDLRQLYVLDDLIPCRAPRAHVANAWERWNGPYSDEVSRARRALGRLHPLRADSYDDWLRVGMSLRDLGADGLRLWEEWSARSPKYRAGECDAKWRGFAHERRGITLGTLFALAAEDDPNGEPQRIMARERRVEHQARPTTPEPGAARAMSVDAARDLLRAEIMAYLDNPTPTEILVIAAPPGLGKSYLGVLAAETIARRGRRVLYCAPRRDFFTDIVGASRKINGAGFDPLSLWYPWLGRTSERTDGTTPCAYPEAMEGWLAKGHGAISLCSSRLCGWQYVSGPHACAYHRQKGQPEPIIFAQHAHSVLGHPLLETCHLVVGDENPLEVFTHRWRIPRRAIVPSWAPPDDRLTDLLDHLRELSQRVDAGDIERPLSGRDLLAQLGGAEAVLAAVVNPVDIGKAPPVRVQADVAKADYNHVPALCGLLRAEAEEALAGRAYLERVVVTAEGLLLLRGYRASELLPPHVIWLDATANEDVYRELFWPRPVRVMRPNVALRGRIHQVTDRSWARTGLVTQDGELATDPFGSPRLGQLQQLIDTIVARHGYRAPAVVTYKDIGMAMFDDLPGGRLHFYGSRGSNALEGCDALFVAGTPQLARGDLVTLASMVYKRRLRPFDEGWAQYWRPYDMPPDAEGRVPHFPVSTFADPDLQALHWQLCEAELIQAVHRARPLLHDVDVWLLTNRPLDGVPIHRLWSLRELLADGGTPEGVDPWVWGQVWPWAEQRYREAAAGQQAFDIRDLRAAFGLTSATAQRYLEILAARLGGHIESAVMKGRGRPARALWRG